ncbi:MAG: ATP-binding protein [Anaerolineae bacterium]
MNMHGLLTRGRGAMLEFLREPSVPDLAQTIVAMANAMGGTIVIGMDEDGHIQSDVMDWVEPILERALRLCEPPFHGSDLPDWQSEETPQGMVVTLTIKTVSYTVSIAGREVLVRSGAANVTLSHEQVHKTLVVPPSNLEEDEVPGATLADFDDAILDEYQRNHQQRGALGDILTRSELLRDAGATSSAGMPTVAGLLLFGRHPHQFLPQASILIIRFKGTSLREAASSGERYQQRRDVVGPAARQVEQTWEILREWTQRSPTVEGLVRRESFEYPPEAVREAVVNAICHRDYAVRGQRIEIRLFDDRIEIMSPGGLPGHITLDNILDEHYSRNPRLVRGLYYWGYIEELGQGIDIIYDAMHRQHHPAPTLHDSGRNFTVTLYNVVDDLEAEYGDELNPRQISVLKYLVEHERITNTDYRRLCPEVGAETLRLDLHELVEKRFLLRVGDKRGTYYVRK